MTAPTVAVLLTITDPDPLLSPDAMRVTYTEDDGPVMT